MTTTALTRAADAPAPIAWDQELRGAQYLVRSGLCPATIKSPEAALFIILAGRDLGLSPVAALRNIHVIQGKVEVSADMQLALFARAGGAFRWLALSEQEAALELRAPWLAAPHVSRWTMEDAKRAQLAGGDNWRKYPRAMLRSRAITAGLKDVGFDATAGVYAPGEISEEAAVLETTEEVVTPAQAEEETGEAPTDEQYQLYGKLLRSSVWTEGDVEAYHRRAEGMTRKQMSALLDEIIAEGKARKKAAQEPQESGELALGDTPRRRPNAVAEGR